MLSLAATLEPIVPVFREPPAIRRWAWSRSMSRWGAAVLRVPLLWKLFGANAIIVVGAAATAFALHAGEPRLVAIMLAALLITFAVNGGLVYVALRPLAALEEAAGRISRGEMTVRVPSSLLADRDMARIGRTINKLVERLTSDRTRMRELAMQVINAGEEERARIAHELHDSVAQTLAALSLQTSAALRDCPDAGFEPQLLLMKQLTKDALEEIRTLAHTVYPRVLDDLGLSAALEGLARRSRSPQVSVLVDAASGAAKLPREVRTVLYQVAREALSNALRHGAPKHVTLELTPELHRVTLEVVDDGIGFDAPKAIQDRAGLGLFTMAERVSLVNGTFGVESARGAGTRVTASMPMAGAG